jgi:hypothetical protein
MMDGRFLPSVKRRNLLGVMALAGMAAAAGAALLPGRADERPDGQDGRARYRADSPDVQAYYRVNRYPPR